MVKETQPARRPSAVGRFSGAILIMALLPAATFGAGCSAEPGAAPEERRAQAVSQAATALDAGPPAALTVDERVSALVQPLSMATGSWEWRWR